MSSTIATVAAILSNESKPAEESESKTILDEFSSVLAEKRGKPPFANIFL